MWLSLAIVVAGATGTMTAALAYKVRERARLQMMTESARALARGGTVRYRSVDQRMKATAEWELTIPRPEADPSRGGTGRGEDRGESGR
ncbi:hypothetical protein [Streptomyces antimycoticus]|uniref:hypothetical protein n=1 Tax=Streptomyces antimycoticus TaxID=68175 RepID=UPI00256FAD4F|nr:hypothetical protein [Streptomyces antimycoticus]WJD98260.1 hypothetical protein QR300_20985 [Streptomyces antimycoticus]